MNKVIFMGNMVRDPEVRYTQGSDPKAVVSFSLAINRKFAKDGEENVDFFNCVAFGKTGEFVEKYFKKGSRMLMSGRIQNNNYTNKNGEKVYAVQIVADDIEFAERKSVSESNTSNAGNANAGSDDFMNVPEGVDSLPFN